MSKILPAMSKKYLTTFRLPCWAAKTKGAHFWSLGGGQKVFGPTTHFLVSRMFCMYDANGGTLSVLARVHM